MASFLAGGWVILQLAGMIGFSLATGDMLVNKLSFEKLRLQITPLNILICLVFPFGFIFWLIFLILKIVFSSDFWHRPLF